MAVISIFVDNFWLSNWSQLTEDTGEERLSALAIDRACRAGACRDCCSRDWERGKIERATASFHTASGSSRAMASSPVAQVDA